MVPKVIFCFLLEHDNELIFILQMLYFDRSDVSESIDVNKTSTSKELLSVFILYLYLY